MSFLNFKNSEGEIWEIPSEITKIESNVDQTSTYAAISLWLSDGPPYEQGLHFLMPIVDGKLGASNYQLQLC